MERFHLAVRGSADGLWDVAFVPGEPWHEPAQPVWYSSRLREMLGFKEHEFPNVLGSWDAQLHPDDRHESSPPSRRISIVRHLSTTSNTGCLPSRESPAGSARAGKPFGTNPDAPPAWQVR